MYKVNLNVLPIIIPLLVEFELEKLKTLFLLIYEPPAKLGVEGTFTYSGTIQS